MTVCSEHFTHKVIDSEGGCTVQQLCAQNKQDFIAIFVSVEHLPKKMRDQRPRDVILMNRVFNCCIVLYIRG